jgi:dTDP-4-amino-4,6-dideoxygalactose transaminase
MNAHQVTKDFEREVAAYCGAPYAVAVNSCTAALMLAVKWHLRGDGWARRDVISIPKRTYVSVPMSIIHAGGRVAFRDEDWSGAYELRPYPIWDSARWFTSGFYRDTLNVLTPGAFVCVSFHVAKILGDSQGGAILHDSPEADAWFRRMRFDGRTEGVAPKDDDIREIGHHCYMSPDVSARLLNRLSFLPRVNAPLPNDDYPDLSKMEIFR